MDAGFYQYGDMAVAAANKYGVPPALLEGLITQETHWNTGLTSPAGAQGIAQFMPATAKAMGVNPWDVGSALDGAARLLKSNYDKTGDWNAALAGYNGSPKVMANYVAGNPIPAETTNYIAKVTGYAKNLFGWDGSGDGSVSPGTGQNTGTAPTSTVAGNSGTSGIAGLLGFGSSSGDPNSMPASSGLLSQFASGLFDWFGGAATGAATAGSSNTPQTSYPGGKGLPGAGGAATTYQPGSILDAGGTLSDLAEKLDNMFTFEFWKSVGAQILLLLVVLAFMLYGIYGLVR